MRDPNAPDVQQSTKIGQMTSQDQNQARKFASPSRKPSLEKIKARLVECRRTQRLNFTGLEIREFPPKFVSQAKAAGVSIIFELDVRNNYISILPGELTEFRALRVLKLDNNCFHEIPKVVYSFAKLQVLSIANNAVKEIDSALQDLVCLREIDLSLNNIAKLPTFWTHMPSLLSLNLGSNKLTSIPATVGAIKSLQQLDLSENNLSSLPRALQHLQDLISLDVHGNAIDSLPTTLCHLKMLQKLDCGKNPLQEPGLTISLQGFDNFMGYLRTSFEEEQIPDLALLRPKETVVGPCKRFVTKCNQPNWPIARVGHSVSQVETKTFIFGGIIKKYGKVDELLALDSRTMIWSQPVTNGCPPSPRDNHSAAFDGKSRLYFFGGRNDERKLLNDLFYLELQSMTWTKPMIDGNLPAIRDGAAMVVIKDKVILFGGCGVDQLYNDVNVLDTTKWVWTPQSTKGLRPCPRKNVAIIAEESTIYIQGGRASLVYDDMYALCMVDLTWCRVPQEGLKPRYGHMATMRSNQFFVIGGFNESGSPDISLHALTFDHTELQKFLKRQSASMTFPQETQLESTGTENWCHNHQVDIPNNDILKWCELESPASADLVDMFSFRDDQLIIMNEDQEILEDSTNPLAYRDVYRHWNIYMEVELAALKVKVSEPVSRKRSYEHRKVDRVLHNMCANRELQQSSQALSAKEQKLMDHIKRFSDVFMQEYPDRRPLKLVTIDECGVQTFICSLIRPSQTPHPEFYNWEGATKFLAKYLDYEPLETRMDWPLYLPSPSAVIKWSRGDCFDFSIALASLLIGVGYDAYCAVGYAPPQVTSNDQMLESLRKMQDLQGDGISAAKSSSANETDASSKYKQRSNPILSGPFLAKLRDLRGTMVGEFAQKFLSSHEEELIYGRTDEQDVLLSYIKDRITPSAIPDKQVSVQLVPESQEASSSEEKALQQGKLHCWVMISSGKREVNESFFIEPTTGFQFPLPSAPYFAVELVFNNENVWINIQSTPHTSTSGLIGMSWDFEDLSKWEKVLDSHCVPSVTHNVDASSPGALSNKKSRNSTMDSPRSTASTSATLEASERRPSEKAPTGGSQGTPVSAKPSREGMRGKEGPSLPGKAKTAVEDTTAYQWLLPRSRAPKVTIPMETFVTRFTKGMKTTILPRCEHTMYALYGDYMRWDGLLERVIFYADDRRTQFTECHDWFQRRNDKLQRRIYYARENKVQEIFGLGTKSNIKEILFTGGSTRKFVFHPGSRVDGLVQREEVIGKQFTEEFDGQVGELIHRKVEYETSPKHKTSHAYPKKRSSLPDVSVKQQPVFSAEAPIKHEKKPKNRVRCFMECNPKGTARSKTASSMRHGGKASNGTHGAQPTQPYRQQRLPRQSPRFKRPSYLLLPISKITETYVDSKSESSVPTKYKKVSRVESDHIQISFHYLNGHISHTSRLYEKDGSYHALHVDPFQPTIVEFQRLDEFQRLMAAERECVQRIREAESEMQEILAQRAREEQNVVILKPYPDIGKYSVDEEEDEDDGAKVESDYLSSFFPPNINPRQHLTRPQMIVVRDNCVQALKEQLMRRANIIATRLELETTTLSKKRAAFERDREGMTVSQEEEYEKSCDEARFRIRVLQQRQKHHEEKSLERYAEMERKLQSDPRFAKLYQGDLN